MFVIPVGMIMDLPDLIVSTGAALEQRVGALKVTGAVFPPGVRFQSRVSPEVNQIPINPKLMKAERALHEHCNLSWAHQSPQ